ncbi:hypothetical protein MMC07_003227 [Pseudocyphellaria aurata]|nr:hypothetical protein [Pseudocyphellaria aurata]
MPYNTRRKSLSLPSLGIQLPHGSRAHRPSLSKSSIPSDAQPPPTKKVKRSHSSNSPSPISSSRPRSLTASSTKTVSFAERPKSSGRATYDHTPPPSPGASGIIKIDTDGIKDDIVVGVIDQLEKTGNRPHLIKELAAVLSVTNHAVLGSANPSALLSSRLSAYLRRPDWSALSPCPLAKELIPIHPRKVFYYLTTIPRQVIPADSSDILPPHLINGLGSGGKVGQRIISPSLSNASMDEDGESAEDRKRDALSPSPEVDLSSPEFDEDAPGADDDFNAPPTPAGSSFSGRSSLTRDGTHGCSSEGINLVHNHRAASPPLEGDEKEFTQTASSMRMRGMSLEELNIRQSTEVEISATDDTSAMQVDETEEEKAKRNREAAATLFGGHDESSPEMSLAMMSSPLVDSMQTQSLERSSRREGTFDVEMKEPISILGDGGFGVSWDVREPESIELEELDDLFGGF